MPEYLNSLNDEQRKACEHTKGPLLVIAGAGSGKTRVITYRILHLIASGEALPEEILAITFTNKAAQEMRERVAELLRQHGRTEDSSPFIKTFHSMGVSILRENSQILGLPKRFSIYDRNDSLKIVKDAMKSVGLDPKDTSPGKILSLISKRKGSGLKMEDYAEEASSDFERKFSYVWENYEKNLTAEKALDFDDLLLKTKEVFQRAPEVLRAYQERWKYVHIDEYQDTNEIQYELSKMLAARHQNVCAVGDADQNIYSWRGAKIKNILSFQKDYPESTLITLEQNYRSTKKIIEVSEKVIEKNKYRFPKKVFTENKEGDDIELYPASNEKEEAMFVTSKVESLNENKVSGEETAVLYRAHFQSRILEEIFLQKGIPYEVVGTKFFERKEIKDVLSFVEASLNRESSTNISRIINVPPRGIGKVTLLKVLSGKRDTLPASTRVKVDKFFAFLDSIKQKVSQEPPSKVLQYIIESSGLKAHLESGSEDDLERLLNAEELVTLAQKYDNLPPEEAMEKLLEEASLSTDADELGKMDAGQNVKLMTVHAAKGLEFDNVFVTGLEDGLFPLVRESSSEEEKEEERRLFYVAVTRARKKLFLSYAISRTIYGSTEFNSPSEFISDISTLVEGPEATGGYLDIIDF